jgi:hypothetical protein
MSRPQSQRAPAILTFILQHRWNKVFLINRYSKHWGKILSFKTPWCLLISSRQEDRNILCYAIHLVCFKWRTRIIQGLTLVVNIINEFIWMFSNNQTLCILIKKTYRLLFLSLSIYIYIYSFKILLPATPNIIEDCLFLFWRTFLVYYNQQPLFCTRKRETLILKQHGRGCLLCYHAKTY